MRVEYNVLMSGRGMYVTADADGSTTCSHPRQDLLYLTSAYKVEQLLYIVILITVWLE